MSVGCGEFHSVALSSSGMVYTWGGGGSPYNRGQLGHGHSNDIEVPAKIMELTGKQVVHITAGGYHTLALTSDNILYAWGSGYYGECGYGEFANTLLPKRVIFSPNYKDVNTYILYIRTPISPLLNSPWTIMRKTTLK